MSKIFLIEDSSFQRQFIEKVLAKWGFSCVMAKNGTESISLIKETPDIKVLFLDLGLPDIDGLDLFARIRSETTYQGPIVILSAKNEIQGLEKAKAMGAYGYILKPIKVNEFKELLDNLP